jgi:hypothetical protein
MSVHSASLPALRRHRTTCATWRPVLFFRPYRLCKAGGAWLNAIGCEVSGEASVEVVVTRELRPVQTSDRVLGELDDTMRLFIARQEMMFVATFDDRGERGCTFRTGPAGFVHVLDVKRVAWPEYPEDVNLGSVVSCPDVSLLFVNFRQDAIGLHIDGRAKVLDDRAMRRAYRDLPEPEHGQRPEHWVTVFVEGVHTAH